MDSRFYENSELFAQKVIKTEPQFVSLILFDHFHNALTSTYVLKVKDGQYDAFVAFAKMIVELTSKEPGTLTYQYSASADQKTETINELYQSSEALLSHVKETFGPRAGAFLETVDIEKLYVYGTPNAEGKAVLDSFGAIYMTALDGSTGLKIRLSAISLHRDRRLLQKSHRACSESPFLRKAVYRKRSRLLYRELPDSR
ncbi:MAG: hypothetical protein EOP06_05470 [Proteobacteria bacterium]|nr:MAG: hypothetical protein EOP06_05470 [Pseudomonadota bacterium]